MAAAMPNPLWSSLAARAKLSLSDAQLGLLDAYIDALLAANQTMNLTRIDTRDAAEVGHVGDALTLLPYIPRDAKRLADVGSGGGIPGIPLAIARPDLRVLLIESTQKKANFLAQTARALRLTNVDVSSKRAEDEARTPGDREGFDVVTARALAEMRVLAEWCLPLTKVGGRVLAMKGGKIAEELPAAVTAIKQLGGGGPRVHPADLPEADYHVVVEVPKVARTDSRYPRPTQQVRDRPL
jgi:16S rRNA (guanine527-N7)-methyltransferase